MSSLLIFYFFVLLFVFYFIVINKEFFRSKIVGDRPFQSFVSVLGISVFVLISSQLLGNVAVIQLALPNVQPLPEETKRFAWAILSFVATIGGNLTITGSAGSLTCIISFIYLLIVIIKYYIIIIIIKLLLLFNF